MELNGGLRIPIWLEARLPLEQAALLRYRVRPGDGLARGDDTPVMLIPGFLTGDLSLTQMAGWLRGLGYRPCRAGMRANVDCTERALARLESQLERFSSEHSRRVTIIGQSRGGAMARILAVRRPDLVDLIICLGSPLTDQFAVHPFVGAQVRAVAALGSIGIPGLFSFACRGRCCVQAAKDLTASFPRDVGFVSVFSRTDGIVDWRACLDPAADAIEVSSSHAGMAVNPAVYRVVALALPRPKADSVPALAA